METTIYTIEQGKHYASPASFSLNNKLTVTRKVKFSPECVYDFLNNDSYDWNKTMGISNGLHQMSSCRFGWRPEYINEQTTGKIEHCFITYNGGEPLRVEMCSLLPNHWYWFTISILNNGRALFTIESEDYGSIASVNTAYENDGTMLGYFLNPYFGGNNAAPHDMTIEMQNVGERIICLKD